MVGTQATVLPQERYPVWFGPDGFVGNTNEKQKTLDALEVLVDNVRRLDPAFAHRGEEPINLLDIGCGQGVLTGNTTDMLFGFNPGGAHTFSCDALPDHADETTKKLTALGPK